MWRSILYEHKNTKQKKESGSKNWIDVKTKSNQINK